MAANAFRCFEGPCYNSTAHLPAPVDLCLAHVSVISNDGTDASVPGVHVWGGPLAGGSFVVGIENRGSSATDAEAKWAWLEAPGLDGGTSACVRELFSDKMLGVFVGGVTVSSLGSHDIALLRVLPNTTEC
jgi:hypothetical protein